MNRHNTLPFSFVSSLLLLNHLQPRAKVYLATCSLDFPNTTFYDLFLWVSQHKSSLPLQPVPGVVGRPITDRGRDPTAWIYAQWVTTVPDSRLQSTTIEPRGRGYYISV